ncbi:spike base protein, RCAP_Rcc01079 family [Profundibacterium mesophilum]|uniref:Uncharacterized protein n=1 Tax=Profundibacterium mesophilum KAUST100406-0324 TaxID=1037889 RepID=A0A921NZD5_9RHOB|nr:hypothetical protein [Profundibacterium mesophilum]KAF0677454.1 hypothetical protein PMES_00243 [Profundibacterium mesophilum KAUST100406-0324]
MSDRFSEFTSGLTGPASQIFAIVPDDGADLAQATRAINVAQGGAVTLTTIDGTTGTIHVAAGMAFPVRARRIHATGTDATGITGLA